MTGAGLSDCKNALAEAEGDLDAAVELVRKRGQAIAAKRSDREAAEGCVLVKVDGNYGAILALKCETDFVAKNADFVALAKDILDAAVVARCKNVEEVKALTLDGRTVAERITDQSGVTGEKMELDAYLVVEGEGLAAYNHANNNSLCTLVALSNKVADETVGKNVAMQVASAAPLAIDESEAQEIRELKEKTAAEKEANLNEQMIQNIAKGRLAKFFKEVCLLEQEYIWDKTKTIAQFLNEVEKGLTVTGFQRYTLSAE